MRDTWNDVAKYVKKKAKTNLDDKIAKVRKERKALMNEEQTEENEEDQSGGSEESSSEEELSEDELVEDAVKTKEGDIGDSSVGRDKPTMVVAFKSNAW